MTAKSKKGGSGGAHTAGQGAIVFSSDKKSQQNPFVVATDYHGKLQGQKTQIDRGLMYGGKRSKSK